MDIKIPKQVQIIIDTLAQNGHEAYIVGGCVRDSLRGALPQDWDITTSALPQETARCFASYRLIQNGAKHGTVGVITSDGIFEITTYRIDGGYSDNRRPDSVSFTRKLREDLSRRDFTVNAMAYSKEDGILDFFGGIADLSRRSICCVGEANRRFEEDALRILRALRFASVLNFTIEEKTAKAIHRKKERLLHIAEERIIKELLSLLTGENVGYVLRSFYDVLAVCIPELASMFNFDQNTPYHNRSLWEHTVTAVEHIKADAVLRLAMLFHDIGKPVARTTDANGVSHYHGHPLYSAQLTENILKKLRFPNSLIKHVVLLVLYHDYRCEPTPRAIKRLLQKTSPQIAKELICIRRADAAAQSGFKSGEKTQQINAYEKVLEEVLASRACFSLKDLAVNGTDLLSIGIPQGKTVGVILNGLMEQVIDGTLPNEKKKLLEAAKTKYAKK